MTPRPLRPNGLGVVRVPGGEAFTADQRRGIERARTEAGQVSGLTFHVYIGATDGDPRATAHRLHAQLPGSDTAVLVLVDPPSRALEIVTGRDAHLVLDDKACSLVALSMQAAFAAGDLAGGIMHGLHQLGEHARRPESLHTADH